MTTPSQELDIAGLRKLLADGTQGKWLFGSITVYAETTQTGVFSHIAILGGHQVPADGALIAAAINSLPTLLDIAERQPATDAECKEMAVWLIYSREHNAFWRPDSCGYTWDITKAGRYTKRDADERCDIRRNNDGGPDEVAIVAPEAIALLRRPRQTAELTDDDIGGRARGAAIEICRVLGMDASGERIVAAAAVVQRHLDGVKEIGKYRTDIPRQTADAAEMRERCAALCDARVKLENEYATMHPGGIELHALRLAVYQTAQGLAASIRALPLSPTPQEADKS